MLHKIKQIVKKYIAGEPIEDNSSINITDVDLIASFLANPDFPWFISFPRTGSHWLRMIMELYFEKPSLVEIYFYKDAKDFTCFHRHDTTLSFVGCRNVLYLYRDPVDTIYSQLCYDKDDINDENRIRYWTELYGKHLSKWLYDETFTIKKTIIAYEDMKNDMHGTFRKVCEHFDAPFDAEKLDSALKHVSKEKLKEKIKHTPQVVRLSSGYEDKRAPFRKQYASMIYDVVCEQNEKLKAIVAAK